MRNWMVAGALASAMLLTPTAPAEAGRKAPPVTAVACEPDYYGFEKTRCWYSTQMQCWEARRALHRTKPAYLSPCFQEGLHQDYSGYWALEYSY